MKLNFVSLSNAPELFERVLESAKGSDWLDDEMHALLWNYYAGIQTEPFNNLSQACYDGERLIGLALANDVGDVLGYFGQPISICTGPEFPQGAGAKKEIILQLIKASKERELAEFRVHHQPGEGAQLQDWQLALLNSDATYVPGYMGQIDLRSDEAAIRSDIRKSFRSLVNFGKRSIPLMIVDRDNPDQEIFSDYREFHKRIAGRDTRSSSSWEEMFNLIKSGNAELVVGFYEEAMVSCTFVFHNARTTLYGSGVYDRSLFDKPISHWPLYHAILRAQERGNAFFNLGEVYLSPQSDAKEKNIAFFKKGFTSRVKLAGHWNISNEQ